MKNGGFLLANMIPFFRRKKKIKQTDMAKALNVSPSYLCKVEKGLAQPTASFKGVCAKYLKVSKHVLFPEDEKIGDIKNIKMSFTNRLWCIRKEKGIKQYELAKKLNCSPSYLSKVEKGLQDPTERFRKNCAKILKEKEASIFP